MPAAFQPADLSEVVMAVAFAIEDPCGVEAIELARALIDFGRVVAPSRRREIALHLRSLMNQSRQPFSL
jgi:hypothetical protein